MKKSRVWLICILPIFCWSQAFGVELEVRVVDSQGRPLENAVVYAKPNTPLKYDPPSAVMDQQHKTFVPHVLAVPQGTRVNFPNTDTVNHYVYSFSPSKSFQFKLFKKDLSQHQVVFDKPGLVTLGCNIHDFMLGYIFVAPTPFVGLTGSHGSLVLRLPDSGDFSLHLWHELADENLDQLTLPIHLPMAQTQLTLGLHKKLKAPRLMHPETEDY